MLLAQHEYRQAWGDRGGGFADTVSPEGWQGFADHYEKAEAHCRAALQVNPQHDNALNNLGLVLYRQGRYLEAFVIAGFAAGIAAVASLMIRRQARGMTAAA